MDHRALDHALEARRGLGILAVIDDQAAQLIVHIVGERGAERRKFDLAGVQHTRGVLIVDQAEQQVLQRRILMLSLIGVRDSAMQGFFELAGK